MTQNSHKTPNDATVLYDLDRSDSHPWMSKGVVTSQHDDRLIEIVSESQAILRVLQIIKFESEVELVCHRQLQLADHHRISFKGMPNHFEISGSDASE